MIPILLHIYGPFFIQSYGFCIVIGLLLFIFGVKHDNYFQSLKAHTHLFQILYCAIFAAFFGGRTLSYLTDGSFISWSDFFSPLNTGFSILGSVIGILTLVPAFLRFLNLPIMHCLDVIATYAPLVQSFGRIGCFCAGCCYGIEAHFPWCIMYTHPLSLAPHGISCHPTQLYSAFFLLLIFLYLKKSSYTNYYNAGKQTALYLIMVSTERFFIDFWRAERFDQLYIYKGFFISDNQIISICIFLTGLLLYIFHKKFFK